ncbi:MAG: NUDIX hydrolase [Candidatus Diapherotrites archaeon]|jgi:ADP-ribose pyrophosphatase|nr:NUDIX hydrolase [Candidatus Diapherotrites archaeon]MBT4596578.1 NUDIX hydrolase [Candidatus Diapherotrites archaeon]
MTHVKIGKWKPVFKGKVFTIEQVKSVLPNGKIKIMERATRKSTIGVIAIDSKKRIFLNYEYKIALKKYIWKIPAGGIKDGETPEQTVHRELMEELGYDAKKIKLFYKTMPQNSINKTHSIYLATQLTPRKLYDEEEISEIKSKPMTIDEAYKMAKNGEIDESETIAIICKLYWNKQIIDDFVEE